MMLAVNVAHRIQVAGFRIDPHRFGHAADEEVQFQKFDKAVVNQGMW